MQNVIKLIYLMTPCSPFSLGYSLCLSNGSDEVCILKLTDLTETSAYIESVHLTCTEVITVVFMTLLKGEPYILLYTFTFSEDMKGNPPFLLLSLALLPPSALIWVDGVTVA